MLTLGYRNTLNPLKKRWLSQITFTDKEKAIIDRMIRVDHAGDTWQNTGRSSN